MPHRWRAARKTKRTKKTKKSPGKIFRKTQKHVDRTSNYASGAFDRFFFEKNLQGDVVGIYNANGKKICTYKYDAWGECTTEVVGSASSLELHLANEYNPFRYRGYYYDTETGFYYVSSRYYDPEVGRWINADGYVSKGQGILGNNMFAYCGNNPVNRVDPTGHFWSEIWEFAKTAVTEIGKAIGVLSPAYAGCGGAAVADGLLPVGDIIGAAVAVLLEVT